MNSRLILKDFLWWIIKENRLVNWLYLNGISRFFPVLKVQEVAGSLTTKKDVQSAPRKPQSLFYISGYTSGTTNSPMRVYRSIKSIILEEYIVKSYLAEMGCSLRPKIAILRGEQFGVDTSTDNYAITLPFSRRLLLSSFHLSASTASSYLKALTQAKPEVIMAYPSAITLLAKYALALNWTLDWPLRGVMTSSESFSRENQALVGRVFGNVFDHYGQAERVAVLQQCEQQHYHVRQDYGLVEFVDDGKGTKIVGTSWYNKAMPLQRYDTGDYVEGLERTNPCACGKTSPYVTRIIGRDDDYIVLPDGTHIGRLDVAFKQVTGLAECQLVQTHAHSVDVNYVPNQGVDSVQLGHEIAEKLNQIFAGRIDISLNVLSAIPRAASGKFKSVVRKVS